MWNGRHSYFIDFRTVYQNASQIAHRYFCDPVYLRSKEKETQHKAPQGKETQRNRDTSGLDYPPANTKYSPQHKKTAKEKPHHPGLKAS